MITTIKMELPKLNQIHLTQYVDSSGKSNWISKHNQSEQTFFSLPGYLSEQEVFSILDVMKLIEKQNILRGKEEEKSKYLKLIKNKESLYIEQIRSLEKENERLASILDKYIGEQ